MLQQKDQQSHHELRRKDQECSKLKERLLRVLAESKGGLMPGPTPGVEATGGGGVLPRGRRGRAGWGTEASTQVWMEYNNNFIFMSFSLY